jgi:hypothetical protein
MTRDTLHDHNPLKASHEDASELASGLAPLEEQERGARARRNGAIVLDTQELKLPKELIEESKPAKGLGLEPVVIFILAFMLAFIAFIAYLISIEPPQ